MMKMKNDLFELTRTRRSVRRYGSKHIDDEIISEIMKVALTAPTSFGHKPVEYVVVRDKDMIRKIGACKQMGGSQINGADAVIERRITPEYHCDCSRSRVEKALISIGRKELEGMISDGEPVTLHCDFCNTDYTFSIEELKDLMKKL